MRKRWQSQTRRGDEAALGRPPRAAAAGHLRRPDSGRGGPSRRRRGEHDPPQASSTAGDPQPGTLAPAEALAARGRPRTAAARDRAEVLRAVAAILGETPGATLQAVADRLAALRLYPPRGGTQWSTSSVAHLVKAARREGLLGET